MQGFHCDTNIYFYDGTIHTFKEVVDKKLIGPVLTYQHGNFVYAYITDWHVGDLEDNWNSFKTTTAGASNGINGFTCTDNIMFNNKSAKDIIVNDNGYSWYIDNVKDNIKDIVYGSLLGDGSITTRKDTTASLIISNNEQEDYLKWKLDKLSNLNMTKKNSDKSNKNIYNSDYSVILKKIHDLFYEDGFKYRLIPDIELTPLMMAVWYMDDGNLSSDNKTTITCKRILKYKDVNKQIDIIRKQISELLHCKIDDISYYSNGQIRFINGSADKLYQCIEKYVIPSMQYKLPDIYKNKYIDFSINENHEYKLYDIHVIDKAVNSPRKLRSKKVYNIEINGQFLIGGDKGIFING